MLYTLTSVIKLEDDTNILTEIVERKPLEDMSAYLFPLVQLIAEIHLSKK